MEAERKINLVTDRKGTSNIKKLRIIFPDEGGEEIGVSILERIGLVTIRFTSLKEMENYIKPLVAQRVKLDELIIGSHGQGGNLLTTQVEGAYVLNNSFLDDIKPLINAGKTNVLFTACHGADELRVLKDAAEKLNTKVYGIAGVSIPGLNKVLNLFKEKIFSCEPRKVEGDTMKMSNEELLKGFYCHSEMNHPINWLKIKK